MKRTALLLTVASAIAATSMANAQDCDRNCLSGHLDQYLAGWQ